MRVRRRQRGHMCMREREREREGGREYMYILTSSDTNINNLGR